MLKMTSNFFETSIAALSIFDVFIILLFILAIVLSIISGIIIVSASVKKVNVELDKSKNIQNINEKIIQNRLDLIISKLSNSQKSFDNTPDIVDVNSISNSNIKQVINKTEATQSEELDKSPSNIIKLPPPHTLDTMENSDGFDVIAHPKEEVTDNSNKFNANVEESINTNIILTPKDIPSSTRSQDEESVINVKKETINLNSKQIPENVFIDSEENDKNEITVNIKDDLNKEIRLTVNTEDSEDNNTIENTKNINYETSNIPLTPNKDIGSLLDDEEASEDSSEIVYGKEKEKSKEISDGIDIANNLLNQIETFSDKEKFNIVNYITDDGYYINCLVKDKLVPLTNKELIRQLFIQQLNYQYEYPLELIEVNYPIELNNNSVKKCDVIVLDQDYNPYIIGVLANSNYNKKLKRLRKLIKATDASFGVIVTDSEINYYQYLNNEFEQISDIPAFNENLDNNYDSNSQKAQFISSPKSNNNYKEYQSNTSFSPLENSQNNQNYFSKDKYNIYKKDPYSLSAEYQTIIEKYRNQSSVHKNVYSNFNQNYNNIPFNKNDEYIPITSNYPENLSNNFRINLNNQNNYRDAYMNRYNNMYQENLLPRPLMNNMNYNNQNYSHSYRYNSFNSLPRYVNNTPTPFNNINHGYPTNRPTINNPNYNNVMPINNRPLPPVNNFMPINNRPLPPVNNFMPANNGPLPPVNNFMPINNRPLPPVNNFMPANNGPLPPVNNFMPINNRPLPPVNNLHKYTRPGMNLKNNLSNESNTSVNVPSVFKAYKDLANKASVPPKPTHIFNTRFKNK